MNINRIRSKWAAMGAAVAVSLGAGGIGITHATTSSGERPIYLPISPCRLADLRPAPDQVGPRSAPLGPDETYTLSGWGSVGNCNLPANTTALALNVTALNATEATFLTIFPGAGAPPLASSLNPTPGEPPTPNAVNVDLDAAGMFSVFNKFGSVNVVIDVVGVYDDHNHDDRYYTEAELDERLDNPDTPVGLPDAMAGLNADGSIRSGGENIQAVTYNAALNRYQITFTDLSFSINDDIAQVTARDRGVTAAYSSVGGSTLLVFLTDDTGADVQEPFTFVVWDEG